jgi:hypothetical protein
MQLSPTEAIARHPAPAARLIRALSPRLTKVGIASLALRSREQCPDKLGVNNYVVKPVEFDHFSETVAKAGFYWMLMNRTP